MSTEDATTIETKTGRYRGSRTRYDDPNCATQKCPYVLVTELPYERQLDEPDGPYHSRLYERVKIARSHNNLDEMAAIFSALQTDIGIPEDGLHIPCRDLDEWLVLAYIQDVKPDAWEYAECTLSENEEENWFTGGLGARGRTLEQELRDLFDPAGSNIGSIEFLGPDGRAYNFLGGDYHSYQNRSLVALMRNLARELGLNPLASLDRIRPTRFAFQTTEPLNAILGSFAFEYEALKPGGKVDFGENVLVAQLRTQTDARNGKFNGPFGKPTGAARQNIGVMPARGTPVLVHNGRGGPFVSLARQGLQSILQKEGLSQSQYRSLRKSNPARYQKIRTRTLQSARLRIPGVRADMKTATSRGEQVVRDKGGVPNFHSYKAENQGVFVKPDGFIGARTDATGRALFVKFVQEVKHVAYQAYTQQIRGQVEVAKDLGGSFILYVPQSTVLSRTLRDAAERKIFTITRF